MRKTKQGVVVSNKMEKTVVVLVERKFPHPFYGKIVSAKTKFKAHDEKNECQIGDVVEISETRPISRDKRWRITKIMGKTVIKKQHLPKTTKKEESGDSATK
ncbi:30S ribosomal protein S17 [candidate division WOR-1 bacterium RIFOXYB2_FULL_42_35]|uniref:Small ribosomal subunit protein uS17 n=1 Tax=candidate division WOR-1 bacterium RIFOXYC2_FULL_41_25 TaxID=1802586 RepID=A0A1F4TLZ4_UNCSA|nr:MAG: 30S ribosomal protein S17 [candidate division WOR-1 bacterium RIFOXYA2_FULL_41_14]OGC23863.1 MAG: 30S ribosomal protein S17 [candidate division WOR-1 bacterium RIFOXYB2_FULL_42_35]OGC33738.1 MAG: 30S ribosomal protein S17 [candidate division WOR-1 bacterium RIFOXYC2_FULL_41_25]OGC42507.1 MAG: 30S ribosomal protein S17 [candidate division WOR-1 bacterium RIFOXYD2_FULL_41_8]